MNSNTGIRNDAILKVHIVDGINLKAASHFVQVSQHEAASATAIMPGNGPIWNEAVIFDIKDQSKPLIVSLIDDRKRVVQRDQIFLKDVMDYSTMGSDYWLPDDEVNDGNPKLRIRITYNYSDIQKYTSLLAEWDDYILNDINELQWINKYLQQLNQPFGFLNQLIEDHNVVLNENDKQDLELEKINTYRVERSVAHYFEAAAGTIAVKAGVQQMHWFTVTRWMLLVQLTLTMLAS